MKRGTLTCLRIFAMTLAVLTAMIALSVTASARAPEEIREDNLALLTTRTNEILGVMGENGESALEPGRLTNNHVAIYYLKLNGLTDAELEQTATEYVINLYYTQGMAINEVAWIYYSHVFSGEAKDRVDGVFGEIDSAIASATDYNVLKESVSTLYGNGGLCAKMLVCIYSEKLDALLAEGDSNAVKALVDGAKTEIKSCTDNSLAAPEYEEILARTAKAVAIQRNQDKALGELKGIFDVFYGVDGYADNQLYADTASKIDADTTTEITDMNKALLDAFCAATDALSADDGKYGKEYYAKLSAEANVAVETAANDKIADLDALLSDYADELYRAEAKDAILDYINTKPCKDDEWLADLEKEYNGVEGHVEKAALADVDHEVNKAKRRVDLYEQYVDTVAAIKAQKGEDADISDIKSLHKKGDVWIAAAENAEELEEIFEEAMAALEIEEFKAIYADILGKTPADVTIADKKPIEDAINALNALNNKAKADANIILASQKLTELYGEVANQEIDEILGDGALRDAYAEELKDKIDDLRYERIATLIEDTADIVDRAALVDAVLDRYEQIMAEESYKDFSNIDKKELENIATDACKTIVAGAENDEKIASDAITALDRKEAISRINVKLAEREEDALSGVKSEIDAIVAKALEDIAAATDPSLIKSIADKAIFDLEKEFCVQDTIDDAKAQKDKINAYTQLTDEMKQVLNDKLDALLDESVKDIRAASDETGKTAALERFEKALGKVNDEAEKKVAVIKDVEKEIKKALDDLDSLKNLTKSQSDPYYDEIKNVFDDLLETLPTATGTDIDKLKEDFIDRLDLNTAKATAADAAHGAANGANEEIGNLGYLSEEEKQAAIEKIEDERKAAQEKIDAATSADAAKTESDGGISKISDVLTEAKAADEVAKEMQLAEAKKKLEDKHAEVLEAIKNATYLSDEDKETLKNEADSSLETVIKNLDGVKNSGDIATVVRDGEKLLDGKKSKVEFCDNEARMEQGNEAGTALDKKKEEIFAAIDALEYLTDEERAALRAEVEAAVEAAKGKINEALSSEEIAKATEDGMSVLDGVSDKAVTMDLYNAKEAAVAEIQSEKKKIDDTVDAFVYLDDTSRKSIKDKLAADLLVAETNIAGAATVLEVKTIRDNCLGGFTSINDDALLREDNACVDMLRPILIALCVIGMLEAVAILVLVRKKRATALAALGAMPVSMWTMTVMVGIADVAMAVYITYLIIELLRNKPAKNEAVLATESAYDFTPELEFDEVSEPEPELDPEPELEPEPASEPEPEPEPASEPEPEPEPEIKVAPAPIVLEKPKAVKRKRARKAEINVGLLDKQFEAGDAVNIDSLKEKQMIPKNAGRLAVLGRGELNKPLEVSADKFSAAAREKIEKAGGSAEKRG